MAYGWIVLLVVIWALGVTLALVLFRMASDQDRAARHSERRLFPLSDAPITHMGPWCD
jgi:hypothetical protein